MKLVILAGGFGTRLGDETQAIPKPMIEINGKPLILYIMEHYSEFGVNEFIILGGYKVLYIKNYFLNLNANLSNITIDTEIDRVEYLDYKKLPWKVTILDTGLNTETAGRLLKAKKYIGNENFLMTYGDGISDVDISKLIQFHKQSSSIITLTSIKESGRFGNLFIENDIVKSFVEKDNANMPWINGGFMIIEPKIFDYISHDSEILEKDILPRIASEGLLGAFKHYGFWQCVDTQRDKTILTNLFKGPQ